MSIPLHGKYDKRGADLSVSHKMFAQLYYRPYSALHYKLHSEMNSAGTLGHGGRICCGGDGGWVEGSVCCCRGLILLLPGFDFAAAGV